MANMVAASIAQKMGQTNQDQQASMQQPGSRSDSLIGALRSLQTYLKLASEANPTDPDISMVRQVMKSISALIAKDQSEGEGEGSMGIPGAQDNTVGNGSMTGGMGGGMQPPMMPDLSKLSQISS